MKLPTTISVLYAVLAVLAMPQVVLAQYQEPVKTPNVFFDVNIGGIEDSLAGEVQFESRFLWFGEVGRERAQYPAPWNKRVTALVDIGGGVMLAPAFGVGVSYSRMSSDAAVALEVTLPHPAYLDAEATTGGLATGLAARRETAWHVDAFVILKRTARFELRAFGGPSLMAYSGELVRAVAFAQSTSPESPQQTISITGVQAERVRERTVGVNVGADLSFYPTRRLGVGVGARLSGGTITLDAEPMSQRLQRLRVGNVVGFVGLRLRLGR